MRFALILFLTLLSGCKREPTFDEAFKANEADLASKAAQIDAELDAVQSESLLEREPDPASEAAP